MMSTIYRFLYPITSTSVIKFVFVFSFIGIRKSSSCCSNIHQDFFPHCAPVPVHLFFEFLKFGIPSTWREGCWWSLRLKWSATKPRRRIDDWSFGDGSCAEFINFNINCCCNGCLEKWVLFVLSVLSSKVYPVWMKIKKDIEDVLEYKILGVILRV